MMNQPEKNFSNPLPPEEDHDNYLYLISVIFYLEMYILARFGHEEMARLRMEIANHQDWIMDEFEVYLLEEFSEHWLHAS